MKTILLYLLVLLYTGAGINHFWHPTFYTRMIPPYLPAPQLLNILSGIAEMALGILLLFKQWRRFAAWGIAAMLCVFLLVHMYMLQQALHQPHYYITPAAAIFRLALQPLLIAWALLFTRQPQSLL